MFPRKSYLTCVTLSGLGVLLLALLVVPDLNAQQQTGSPVRLSGHQGPVRALAISADGKTLASASWGAVFIWDLAQLKGTQLFEGRPDVPVLFSSLSFSPDSKMLAAGSYDDWPRVWDLTGRNEIRQLKEKTRGFVENSSHAVAFTTDGRQLVVGTDRSLRVWDLHETRQPTKFLGEERPFAPFLTMAGDRKSVILAGQNIQQWDVATGSCCRKFDLSNRTVVFPILLSHDGKSLIAAGQVWELASGGVRRRLKPHGTSAALSPDGRTIALGGEGTIWLRDLHTNHELGTLKGHKGRVQTLIFTADAKRLISGGDDTALLVWDMADVMKKGHARAEAIDPEHVKNAWAVLADPDAAAAFQAMAVMLAADPTQVVAFIGARLHPVKAADPDLVRQLITRLDDDTFPVRDGASRGLEQLGELALPVLRITLAETRSAEVRRRAEELLRKLDTFVLSGEALRSWRALEVLEHINTPDAKQLLDKLSRGAPGARQTEEAKDVLARLAKRPAAT
jgi:WD40 repeat protein